jgi:hypothetical protein
MYMYSTIFRLKKQYRAANERIGKTGAGLNPEDITPGSNIANIIGLYFLLSTDVLVLMRQV